MKNLILITCTSLLFFSCVPSGRIQPVVYNYQGMPYWRGGQSVSLSAKQVNATIGYFEGHISFMGGLPNFLSIKQDGTFEMRLSNVCYDGTWVKVYRKAALLKFNKKLDLGSQLASNVMQNRELIIHFPNKNRVKVDRYTLKRIR